MSENDVIERVLGSQETKKPNFKQYFGIMVVGIPMGLWAAYVMTQLWKWFVMPISATIPQVGVFQMAGLMLFISYYIVVRTNTKTFKLPTVKDYITHNVATIAFIWAAAYVTHLLMVAFAAK